MTLPEVAEPRDTESMLGVAVTIAGTVRLDE